MSEDKQSPSFSSKQVTFFCRPKNTETIGVFVLKHPHCFFFLIPVSVHFYNSTWRSQNVTKVYIRNRLSKYLIISCLSLLNDENIVTPMRKWPQMWCWSISIDRQIIVVVLSFRHCPGPMHEGLNWEWMWLDFQSPSLNSHAGNTNSSI